jgi:hypothetical protein
MSATPSFPTMALRRISTSITRSFLAVFLGTPQGSAKSVNGLATLANWAVAIAKFTVSRGWGREGAQQGGIMRVIAKMFYTASFAP